MNAANYDQMLDALYVLEREIGFTPLAWAGGDPITPLHRAIIAARRALYAAGRMPYPADHRLD
jgi:hypothetical protein